ncbi:MAG TPA: cytosine deaminase, partial [Candidatus Sulfotelmatobacter sp.]|nr:cytosine deaminase [Candidatus Sulfotelmatobacter sp.]
APAPDPTEPSVVCDIALDGARIASVARSAAGETPLAAGAPSAPAAKVVDLDGALVFPGFVDAHVHLDKAHTWDRAPNRSGRFSEALETLARDRENWTGQDLLRRGGFALRSAWEHGTRAVRTHVDTWLPRGEENHAAMHELRGAWRGRIALQTVPITGIANYSGAGGDAIADLAMKYGACALGGWSPMSADLARQLDRILAIARDRGVGLDLHVDENGGPGEEVLRAVAEAVIRNRFGNPVVCGHCCSLAVQPPERQRSTIALVREAAIRVIALPLCNLYLQDRRGPEFPRTPYWRGLTLIHDLIDAGVPLACASDNVRDAFHAYGDFDAAEVYIQSVRLAHLDSRLGASVGVVTSAAADIVGLPDLGRVAPGAPSQLVVFPARSFSEFLSRPGSRRRLVDGEAVRDARPPGFDELR